MYFYNFGATYTGFRGAPPPKSYDGYSVILEEQIKPKKNGNRKFADLRGAPPTSVHHGLQ